MNKLFTLTVIHTKRLLFNYGAERELEILGIYFT
jgi:hypothetical protein